MAKVMIVAGGDWQCFITKKAKEMGHVVISSNLYNDSPAFAYADYCEVADVRDRKRNLEIAKKYEPDAVLTDQSDIAVPTVAYISEQLGLKGIGTDKAKLFTDKYEMRRFCELNGFSYPKYALCKTVEEAKQFAVELGKTIIKPIDSQSSRGIHIIENLQQIEEYFEEAASFSNRDHAVIIEEYIEGTEFTVDGLKTQSDYIVTAISKKKHYTYNPNVASELLFSENDDKFDYEKLRQVNSQMVKMMELPYGLTHAEYKYQNGKFYLIEIAARGGGTRISSDIVPIMSGIDTNRALINMMLGEECDLSPKDKMKYSILGFLDFPKGKVTSISGLDTAKKINGVVDVDLNFCVGDVIKDADDDRSRLGYYIIKANTKEELREIEKKLKQSIVIEVA